MRLPACHEDPVKYTREIASLTARTVAKDNQDMAPPSLRRDAHCQATNNCPMYSQSKILLVSFDGVTLFPDPKRKSRPLLISSTIDRAVTDL
jgi:hypothetical protein